MGFDILCKRWKVIVLSFFCFIIIDIPDASAFFLDSDKRIISIQYLTPTEADRDINKTNIDINYFLKKDENVNLSIYLGLIATYATGSITQLEGSLDAGTFREVHYNNTAVGLGPGSSVNIRLWSNNKFSILLNGRVNLIFYNKEFPAGGKYYNFMWRGGPSV